MHFNRKTSLTMAIFVIFTILIEMDLSNARPSRASRRNKGNRDNKAKRVYVESPIVMDNNGQNNADTIVFPPSIAEKDGTLEINDAGLKGPEKTPPNKWLELERTLPAVVNSAMHSDLTFECVAVGSPPPRVYWLKNGKPIDHVASFGMDQMTNQVFGWDNAIKKRNGGEDSRDFSMANVKAKLPLRCLRPEDQGEYTCFAENDGRQLEASTILTVDETFSPEIRPECKYTKKGKKIQPAFIMSYEYLHMETIGSDVILVCRVGGRPHPQVTWLDFEGKSIPNGKKFRVTESGNLVIKNLSWREMGEYTCRAENEFGSDSASTFLYPLLNESNS